MTRSLCSVSTASALLCMFQVSRPCNCRISSSSLIGGSGAGWEGTALLNHGSYIKLGCMQFIFSILEQAPPPLEFPAAAVVKSEAGSSVDDILGDNQAVGATSSQTSTTDTSIDPNSQRHASNADVSTTVTMDMS